MVRGELPTWIDQEAQEIRPVLADLIRLRRRGIWALRGGSGRVSLIPVIARSLFPGTQEGSVYEPVRLLFERLVLKNLPDNERAAFERYFDLTGAYSEAGAEQRRADTGRLYFFQGYSKFRDENVGKERPFLILLSNNILDAQRSGIEHRKPNALTDEIISLLTAQLSYARDLPYWPYDRAMPDLGKVYVEPSLINSGRHEAARANLREAQASSRHLFVVGEAGIGKSTMSVQTTAKLSEAALESDDAESRRVLPLYVQARRLTSPTPFDELLCAALNRQLATYLRGNLHPSFLASSGSASHEWIIFIDGLDEVLNIDDRRRLIATLVHHSTDERLRFVITSRGLSPQQTELLGASFTRFTIAPFSGLQIHQFLTGWFAASGSLDPGTDVTTFLNRATDFGMRDLIRNPLLSTIAAIAYTANQSQLPHTVPELYEEFISYLLFRRQQAVEAREQLRNIYSVLGTKGLRIADLLYERRREMISSIAAEMLSGGRGDLVAIGSEWALKNVPGLKEVPDWIRSLEDVLIDTGLIMRAGGDLLFIHRTVAEYVAAPVAGLPGEIERGHEWRDSEINAGRESYLIFRIIAWSRENASEPLVQQILSRKSLVGYQRLGKLVRYGLPLPEESVATLASMFEKYFSRTLKIVDWYEEPKPSDVISDRRLAPGEPDNDMIRILCDFASRYEVFVQIIRAVVDQSVTLPAHIAGLTRLWRSGQRGFVAARLARLKSAQEAEYDMALAEYYSEVGDVPNAEGYAMSVLRNGSAGHLATRAACLLDGLGDRGRAERCLSDLLRSFVLTWPQTTDAAQVLVDWGLSDLASELLQYRLESESCAVRGTSALEALKFCGLGWRVDWANRLELDERRRLLGDPGVTSEMRDLVHMWDQANIDGMEWEWWLPGELSHRLELYRRGSSYRQLREQKVYLPPQ